MENTLTQERDLRPTVHHSFDQFELVHLSFDEAIVLGKSESCDYSRFVTLNTKDKAL